MAALGNLSSQARLNAKLRYSPQREALENLTREAQGQYQQSVRGAESAGRLTSAAVEKAQPQVKGIYDRQQAATSSVQSGLAAALAALGPAANGYKAAAAATGAQGQERAGRERAAAESGLQAQDVAAKEAPAFARTLANQQLATSLSKIFSSLQGVAGNEGAATASELGKLENQAEGRSLTERGQNLSHQDSVESRAQKAQEHRETLAAKANPGEKPLGRKEVNAASSTIQQIRQIIGKNPGKTRAQYIAKLTEGFPEVKSETGSIEHPAIKGFKTNAVMAAALDWAEHGHLTRNTESRLRKEGYDPATLGVPLSLKPIKTPNDAAKRVVEAVRHL